MESNTSDLASSLVRSTFRLSRSVFMDEKKLSLAALSPHSPRRLMLQVVPCALSNCWKSSLVVLTALVRVMHQRAGFAAPPKSHQQSIAYQLGLHGVAHRAPHDTA